MNTIEKRDLLELLSNSGYTYHDLDNGTLWFYKSLNDYVEAFVYFNDQGDITEITWEIFLKECDESPKYFYSFDSLENFTNALNKTDIPQIHVYNVSRQVPMWADESQDRETIEQRLMKMLNPWNIQEIKDNEASAE